VTVAQVLIANLEVFVGTDQLASPFDDGTRYDAWMHGLEYGISFYRDLAVTAAGPCLEVACGTGRILLPCLQAGADVDGLDLYEPMLARLRVKATAIGLAPTLYQCDMKQFVLPRRYALIMITFNAFVHNMTQDDQIACLECCRRHLAPGGVLAFDTFFPSLSLIGAPEGQRVLEGETVDAASGRRMRAYDTRTFRRVEQVQHSINEIEILDASGAVVETHRSEHQVRWIYKQEMALLLRVAGYSRWDIAGDFDLRPLTEETDAMIVRAWID
jgi:SAM-dependent methyltransferase